MLMKTQTHNETFKRIHKRNVHTYMSMSDVLVYIEVYFSMIDRVCQGLLSR